MSNGISTIGNCTNRIDCLQQNGYTFACRYYCTHTSMPEKKLTAAEAQALSAAGIYIVAVWENGSPTDPSYFSETKGQSDALAAHAFAGSIGQPAGTPI